jgi:hypothetical protein
MIGPRGVGECGCGLGTAPLSEPSSNSFFMAALIFSGTTFLLSACVVTSGFSQQDTIYAFPIMHNGYREFYRLA